MGQDYFLEFLDLSEMSQSAFSDSYLLAKGLTSTEIHKARHFRGFRDENNFLAGRILLRQMLTKYFGHKPDHWSFIKDDHGKLRLSEAHELPELDFSISHSGDLSAVALHPCGRIGIDLESLSQRVDQNILDDFFCDAEKQAILQKSVGQQTREMLRLWTQKEAYAKFKGLGVSLDFATIDTQKGFADGQMESRELVLPSGLYYFSALCRRDMAFASVQTRDQGAALVGEKCA